MKKYDKVFIPVSVSDADGLFVADEDRYEKHGVIEYVKEQSNVIVLTEDELNGIWNAAREKGFNPKCLGEQPDKYKTLNDFLNK